MPAPNRPDRHAPAAPRRRGGRSSRVLFVTHETERTGAPILLARFLRWLRSHTDLDFEVCALRDGPLVPEFAALAPVHVVELHDVAPPDSLEARLDSLGFAGSARTLRRARQRRGLGALRGFDVLYLNSVLSAPLLPRLREVPPVVVTHLHEMEVALRHAITEDERAELVTATDCFFTCSERATDDAMRVLDAPPVRCRHGFVEPLVPDDEGSRRLRAQLGIADDALVVGGAGSVAWRKGTDLFAVVAAEIVRRRPELDVHFVWAGSPEAGEDVLPFAEDRSGLDLEGRLHLLGEYTSPSTVIGAFDLFLLSSREDPFPLVMLEAATLARPLAAFASGGVSELAAASGDPGRPLAEVVDLLDVDALVEVVMALLDDPPRRTAMGAALQAHVLAHHVTDVAAPMLYDDLRSIEPGLPAARC